MLQQRMAVLEQLEQLDIPYELTKHPAAYTMEDMDTFGVTRLGEVCKNLFLRDAKGKRHYLVVLPGHKRADMKSIGEQLGAKPLSFASEKRLMEHLGLEKGAVSPLGVVNNTVRNVVVVFDQDLKACLRLGVHPNDNTATLWLNFPDLERFILHLGNKIAYIRLGTG